MTGDHDVIIVGGGLSGLSVAHFLRKKVPDVDPVILEKGPRPGGAIRSFREEGFLAEWGAHGFLDNAAPSREILADTGLDREAQKAPLARFVRYICLDGRLAMIPQNPKKIIASALLPLSQKLRVLADLWKKPLPGEQTVSEWAAYRFGKGILPFVDAVFTGTYAGDFERLSIDAVMPGIRDVEKKSGSVIRGLIRQRRELKKTKAAPSGAGLPSMISFPQGMGRLPEVLARDKRIYCNTVVSGIHREESGWRIRTEHESLRTKTVVLAMSVNQTLSLLAASTLGQEYPPPTRQIPEARIVTVVMGFKDSARIPFGFGYLAPEQEKRFSLGALFSTHMFPGRAPAGHAMVEVLVGGRRHPERIELGDEELQRGAYNDLSELIDLPEPPVFVRVLRPPQGIPQLELGYPQLLDWRNELTGRMPGLHICGFGWGGIGINDMTKSAKAVAEAIGKGSVSGTGRTGREIKGVYF